MNRSNGPDEPRISLQGMRVLKAFNEHGRARLSGADVARVSKLASGTLYPILLRFEAAGWLESQWEDVDPKRVGRPRRRLYRLTPTGFSKASHVLAEFQRIARA